MLKNIIDLFNISILYSLGQIDQFFTDAIIQYKAGHFLLISHNKCKNIPFYFKRFDVIMLCTLILKRNKGTEKELWYQKMLREHICNMHTTSSSGLNTDLMRKQPIECG